MGHLTSALLRGLSLLLVTRSVFAMVLFNATDLGILLEKYLDDDGDWMVERQRSKRAISASDMQAILDLHNKLRGQVYPPASNMEYMVKHLYTSTNDKICWVTHICKNYPLWFSGMCTQYNFAVSFALN